MRVLHHEASGCTWRAGPSNWKCRNLRSRQGSTLPSAAYFFGCITQHSSAVADRNRIDRDGGIMLTIRMIVAVTAIVTTIAQTRAQNWPSRPVTIVYPFAAGSAGDVLGRIFASRLSELLGQPVLFENVGGAGGMTGASRVAKAAPDGYQVLLGTTSTLAVNQTFYKHPLLQCGDRLCTGRADRREPDCIGRSQGFARQQSAGVHRPCESEPGEDAIRLGRSGLLSPSRLCGAQRSDRG